jgi:hypothetical protein
LKKNLFFFKIASSPQSAPLKVSTKQTTKKEKRKPFKKSKESKKIKTFLALGERPKE